MLKISTFRRALLLIGLAMMTAVHAEEQIPRPRIGLVLGGGGARGAAHIGVLEILEEMRIPFDCVAGTSMGALVAGAFAAGRSPADMRAETARADWNDMFVDNPEFSEMNYRNKVVRRRFIPGSETGLSTNGVKYPPGAVDGEKIKLFFNQLVGVGRSERLIEKLPLTLSIIATDIGTGERVTLREGSLTSAMRASMSVPGLLSPVELHGKKLVDGGLVDNVPISEVRERCTPDVVIAVNVGSPLLKSEDVGSLLSVSAQMVNILTEQNVTRSLATLQPTDIYIKPDLGTITAGDFARNGEAADHGRAAAEAVRHQLAKLSVDAEKYATWRKSIDPRQRNASRIDDIEVVGLKRVHPEMVKRQLSVTQGDALDLSKIDNDVLRIYGDGYYQNVDYQLLNLRDRNILRILPVEKGWGPDYLRFALNLEADTSQGSDFGLRLAYQKTLINDLGGEVMAAVDIGSKVGGVIDFYQPIDPAQRYFVEAGLKYRRTPWNIYQDDKRVAQYLNSETGVAVWAGANLGLLGQARLGVTEQRRTFTRDIGAVQLGNFDIRFSGWRANLALDQMNRIYFPTSGWATRFDYFDSPEAGYQRAEIEFLGAYAVGKTVFNARFNHTGSPTGKLPFYDAAKLGGFLNMTAFATGQILGDDISYLGVRAEQIIGSFGLGLRGDMRLGVALEAAQVGRFYTETSLDKSRLLDSVGLYFGGETPIGPAYLGVGYSSSGVSNLFLSIGTP